MLLELLIVAWALCPLTAGSVTASRGQGWLVGIIAGGVFGLFGIAMAFGMPRLPTRDETRCDACAEIRRKEALICPHCGKTPKEASEMKAAAAG